MEDLLHAANSTKAVEIRGAAEFVPASPFSFLSREAASQRCSGGRAGAVNRGGGPVAGAIGCGSGPEEPGERGARVMRPPGADAGMTAAAVEAPRFSACRILNATEGGTGAPRFSRMTSSFASKSGGPVGGTARTTIGRARIAAEGRSARPSLAPAAA